MSELETPNLQIKRYVDLLKRRRWQILPVALLGLLIGTVVARLIPRFYEASTQIRIHQVFPDENRSYSRKDPLLREVSDARNTILAWDLVRDAVLELSGWEDFFAVRDDAPKFNSKIRGVQSRIWISDLDPGEGRASATLNIGYRDQDAQRTVDFVRRITSLYIARQTEFVIMRAKRLATQMQKRVDKWQRDWNDALEKMSSFIAETGFNPNDRNAQGLTPQGVKIRRRQKIADEVRDLEIELETALKERESLLAKIEDGRIPREIVKRLDPSDPEVIKVFEPLLVERNRLLDKYNKTSQLNPQHEQARKALVVIDQAIDRAKKRFDEMGKTKRPHPLYIAARARLAELATIIENATNQLEPRRKELQVLNKELASLGPNQQRYAKLQQRVEETHKGYQEAKEASNKQVDFLDSVRANSDQVVELLQPPYLPQEPTYPNKPLVSMLGLLIAVLVAGALIVLLDFLQSSFKTIDEVHRGLPIPVLGGVSYIELPEEVESSRRFRIKVTIISTIALVLIGSLLAIYFLDPVRLPSWVLNLLDGLMGS
jgi:protein tyrosine kinase modulator